MGGVDPFGTACWLEKSLLKSKMRDSIEESAVGQISWSDSPIATHQYTYQSDVKWETITSAKFSATLQASGGGKIGDIGLSVGVKSDLSTESRKVLSQLLSEKTIWNYDIYQARQLHAIYKSELWLSVEKWCCDSKDEKPEFVDRAERGLRTKQISDPSFNPLKNCHCAVYWREYNTEPRKIGSHWRYIDRFDIRIGGHSIGGASSEAAAYFRARQHAYQRFLQIVDESAQILAAGGI